MNGALTKSWVETVEDLLNKLFYQLMLKLKTMERVEQRDPR
ncbi:hypothetical protein TcasGA2_TC012959 [Tribolium castaneum]|uniref:Uncharacterized protein n=1 Tax=Tribolium castaneum TaxID=7070 RepID=D7EKR1_TRICA|nr:hypothetical protein TcasGA2_TC012959 [Tribolium castaneum]